MDRTDESLIALRRILRATELYERDLASAAGVTPAKLRVMQIVQMKGGSATLKALATQMGVSAQLAKDITGHAGRVAGAMFLTRAGIA